MPAEEAGAGAVQMDGEDAQAAEDGSVAASEGLIAGSFKPSEIAQPAQDTYEYPFLGMKLGISKRPERADGEEEHFHVYR